MKLPHSLQWRLGLTLLLLLTLLWTGAASVTAILARHALDEVLDSALQETAQRILPLAAAEVLGRDEPGLTQRQGGIRKHDEFLTYAVRDGQGRLLLLSHDADPAVFSGWRGVGFSQTGSHRLYGEEALQGSVRLTVAEPLAHRRVLAREIQMGLVLPLLVFLPIALLTTVLAVRASLGPLRRFRERLAMRGARDLSLVPVDGLPAELLPVADTLNGLLGRLAAAFEAERNFAANAAHELRTPLAGAIAQAQRLQAETSDPGARSRAAEIEASLKRLTRLSERLLQLARAEGGRLRLDHCADLRPVARLLAEEQSRVAGGGRVLLALPPEPVLSDLDPDVFAILYRNLVENALRHGCGDTPVEVSLSPEGLLSVANEGPLVPEEDLRRWVQRFERAGTQANVQAHGQANVQAQAQGSGLGLAIVHAIAQRIGSALLLRSPRTGQDSGFEATLRLPVETVRGR